MSDLIARARAFAEERHAGQTRKGENALPYITHVTEVAETTARFGGRPETVAAAWLHDVVEDCPPTTSADIAAMFGAQVAALVAEMTDDKSLPKAERKHLQIINAPGKSEQAVLIKLADKISNVRSIATNPPQDWGHDRKAAYLDWAETVVAALPTVPAAALAEFQDAVALARNSLK